MYNKSRKLLVNDYIKIDGSKLLELQYIVSQLLFE